MEEAPESLEQFLSAVTGKTSPVIIYDDAYEFSASLISINVLYDHTVLMYEYRSFYAFLAQHMKSVLKGATFVEYRRRLYFILICRTVCIEDVMRHVIDLDSTIGIRSLLRHFSTWLIISPDPPPNLDITLDNVGFIRFPYVYPHIKTDISYQRSQQLKTYDELTKNLWNQSITDVYTLLWMPKGRGWSRINTQSMSHDQLYISLFPNTRRGLNGRQLLLTTVEWPVYAKRNVIKGKVSYTGASFDAMEILKRKFNFSYAIVEPEDMLWGQEQKNGSCTGVVGMLNRAEADMCPVPYGISTVRKRVMDLTSSIITTENKGVYKKRPNDNHSWTYLLSCFSWQVYLCSIASLVWLLLLLFGLGNHKVSLTSSWRRNLSNCFEIGLHVPLRQALLMLPDSPSARILTCAWCIFCLIMTGIYTGNLVAVATVDKYEPPFTTLQELSQLDEYAVGILEGGYAESILMNTEIPVLRSIYKKVIQSAEKSKHNDSEIADLIQRVIDEKFVVITGDSVIDTIRSMACDIEEMKERLTPLHSAYAFPPNSPLVKLFDTQVLILRERGIFDKLRKEWTSKSLICDSSEGVTKLELKNLKTLMVTCAVCIVLAFVVLRFEIWIVNYTQS